jgi:hypothetical protein
MRRGSLEAQSPKMAIDLALCNIATPCDRNDNSDSRSSYALAMAGTWDGFPAVRWFLLHGMGGISLTFGTPGSAPLDTGWTGLVYSHSHASRIRDYYQCGGFDDLALQTEGYTDSIIPR